MLDHPDPILARADITRLTAEFSHLEPVVVKALYHHLAATRGGQPGLKEARAYIKRVTTRLDTATLWEHLGLPVPQDEDEPPGTAGRGKPRRPGRPGWTAELFRARYREACARCVPPHSFRSLALHFDTLDGHRGIDPDHLRKLARRFGLPPGP